MPWGSGDSVPLLVRSLGNAYGGGEAEGEAARVRVSSAGELLAGCDVVLPSRRLRGGGEPSFQGEEFVAGCDVVPPSRRLRGGGESSLQGEAERAPVSSPLLLLAGCDVVPPFPRCL